jgi:hypothetical protein
MNITFYKCVRLFYLYCWNPQANKEVEITIQPDDVLEVQYNISANGLYPFQKIYHNKREISPRWDFTLHNIIHKQVIQISDDEAHRVLKLLVLR